MVIPSKSQVFHTGLAFPDAYFLPSQPLKNKKTPILLGKGRALPFKLGFNYPYLPDPFTLNNVKWGDIMGRVYISILFFYSAIPQIVSRF